MGIHITNTDETGDVRTILETGQDVAHGQTVEVDREVAERLLLQDDVWKRAVTKAAKAAGRSSKKAVTPRETGPTQAAPAGPQAAAPEESGVQA